MQQILRLKKALRQSQLTQFAEACKGKKFPAYRSRPLTEEEIAILRSNGNHCSDWSLIQVESNFSPERVLGCILHGRVSLPAFFGTVLTPGGVSIPTGLYRSTVSECIFENSHVQDVSLLSGAIISQGAVLQNIGSLVSSGQTAFGSGRTLPVGTETGGRSIWIFPEITPDLAEMQLFSRRDRELLDTIADLMQSWVEEITQGYVFVGKGATICNTNIVRNSWIGPHARIDGAAKIRNTVVLSNLENPCEIYDGVILEGSSLQEGCRIHSFCQIKNSALMRGTRVGRKALIAHSVIGLACHIEEAEITSCYLGPLVQAHHHSLLIAALWPTGRGNLGYGANVGSNHTGRLPDQEIMPGLGQFFGLGCNIKFPSNFSEAPWSLIATGITTLPQRLRFPFSLIREPQAQWGPYDAGLNELHPLWTYGHNAFALERSLYKFASRGKTYLDPEPNLLFDPELARLVLDSYTRLKSVPTIREVYSDKEIPGIGSNILRESVRQEALLTCLVYLERFSVHMALSNLESGPRPTQDGPAEVRRLFAGDLLRDIYRILPTPAANIPALVRRHRTLEKRWMESVLKGQEPDRRRGNRIFDDYDAVHPEDSDLLTWIRSKFEQSRIRCNQLLKSLRPAPSTP